MMLQNIAAIGEATRPIQRRLFAGWSSRPQNRPFAFRDRLTIIINARRLAAGGPNLVKLTKRAREEAELFIEKGKAPAKFALHTRRVQEQFWPKISKAALQIPFAKDLTAAYYAARDPQTPTIAKASLMAALFCFVAPADLAPDVAAGIGILDDNAVLAALMALTAAHIGDKHWAQAQTALEDVHPGKKTHETPRERGDCRLL